MSQTSPILSGSRVVYVSCPYSHPDPEVRASRVDAATRLAAKLFLEGHIVFSPLTMTHPMTRWLPEWFAGNFEIWMRLDFYFLAQCDTLVVLRMPGWEESVGVAAEIRQAAEAGKTIVFVDPYGEDSPTISQHAEAGSRYSLSL